MNKEKSNNSISEKDPIVDAPQPDACVQATPGVIQDVQQTQQTTYDHFIWILNYTKMFATRLGRDLITAVRAYVYPQQDLPEHINNLIRVQSDLGKERELNTASYSREQHQSSSLRYSMKNFVQAFKSYIFTSEDDVSIYSFSKHMEMRSSYHNEPMVVLVNSREFGNMSSTEMLFDDVSRESVLRRFFYTYIKPTELTSSRKEMLSDHIDETESTVEVQMLNINLQSENDIPLDDHENEQDSVFLSYLRNKNNVWFELENPLLFNKKKYSLLESVPRMDTILEGDQFSILPSVSQMQFLSRDSSEDNIIQYISESSLDAVIPSYPGSPRSIHAGSEASIPSIERGTRLREAVNFLHRDHEFLIAAEIGNDRTLDKILRAGTDLQQMDILGRNALHLAVCSNNFRAIEMLVKAGVDTNLKDNVGMTPLSLCLMRRPSMKVANLLFDYGATIMTRTDPMDTGLFIQFVMMCVPTMEESKILYLLVEKGACVNDPDAPGGRQALHFAAMSDNCRLINILMELGADMYLTNHRGETPLDVANTFNCTDAYELLFKLDIENESTTTYATVTTIATIADAIKF